MVVVEREVAEDVGRLEAEDGTIIDEDDVPEDESYNDDESYVDDNEDDYDYDYDE